MNNKLALLVCSNREGINFSDIWSKVIDDKRLDKIVLVTQRKANDFNNRQSKVLHIKLTNLGRSNAINRGLEEIQSKFVGLTDDDCFLDKNWVSQAVKSLGGPSVFLVYGQTFPYQPQKNKGKRCPCTFTKTPNKYSVVSHTHRHWVDIGFDNNAAIKKEVFDKIGGYKWWLGPGSIGKNAEDAEFILRALISKHNIAYNPSMVARHNKWLTPKEWKEASQVYLCGGIAAYGFYAMQGVKECRAALKSDILEVVRNTIFGFRRHFRKPNSLTLLIKDFLVNFYYIVRSLIIAFGFAKIIPIPKKENVGKFIKQYNATVSAHI